MPSGAIIVPVIARIQGKLGNEAFVARARPEVDEKEHEKLTAQEERLNRLQVRRQELEG